MTYKLELDEGVRESLVRNAREQIDSAIEALEEHVSEDPVAAVHTARKAIKKERSLLRLARAAIPAKRRRAENRALRETARGLSEARDAAVLVQTLDALAERFAGQLPESTFAALRAPLEAEHDHERAQLADSVRVPDAARQLAAARARIDRWTLRRGGWDALAPGLERSYRHGRSAMAQARRRHAPEAMHDWRKRVKDLWYHARLLAPAGGPTVRGQAKDLHRLSDLLGDDHDLFVLHERLTGGEVHVGADVDAVVGLIDHRRAELQAEAFHLGERVYAEKPSAFVRRMRRAFQAGRELRAAADQPPPTELARATRAHPSV